MTADIGLDFDVYCNAKIVGFDINNASLPDLEACLQLCAKQVLTPSEKCMAVQWNEPDRQCYLKTASATKNGLEPSNVSVIAFADTAPFQNRPSGCPYANDTVQFDKNGMEYQIYCETDMRGDDHDDTAPSTQYKAFHADTILDCLNFCSDRGPLCYGVVYAERMDWGYRNCFPKQVNLTNKRKDFTRDDRITMAIGLLADANTTCSGGDYQSTGGVTFEIKCDSRGDGPTLNSTHTDRLEDCLDACANYVPASGNGKCANVAYEPNSKSGYLNCHLKPYLSNITANSDWRVATISNLSSGDADTTSDQDTSLSKAWIAGPAVGGVVGVALLIWSILWWQRGKSSKETDTPGRDSDKMSAPEALYNHDFVFPNSDAQLRSPHLLDSQDCQSSSTCVFHEMENQRPHAAELSASDAQRAELSDYRRAELL